MSLGRSRDIDSHRQLRSLTTSDLRSGLARGGRAPNQIVETLAQRYDAPLPAIERAVDELLDRLQQEGLVAVAPAEAPAPTSLAPETTGTSGQRLPFEPPKLDKYDDMQDLILLDPVHEVQQDRGWPHVNPDVRAGGS